MITPKTWLAATLSSFVFLASQAFAAKIAIVHPDVSLMNQVAEGVKKEIEAEQSIKAGVDIIKLKKKPSQSDFDKAVDGGNYSLYVIFDNPLLKLAHKNNANQKRNVPIISVMSLNLKQIVDKVKMTTGIAYETPPFLLITTFDKLVDRGIKRVGVVYRKSLFQWYIDEARQQLKYAKMELVSIPLEEDKGGNVSLDKLKSAINQLKSKNIDAFWMLTDNAIISQKSTKFLSQFGKSTRTPILCGVKNLVATKFDLCSYAVTPDEATIISQGADQAFAIMVDKLNPKRINVEYLESVNKTLNIEKLESNGFNVKKEILQNVTIEI